MVVDPILIVIGALGFFTICLIKGNVGRKVSNKQFYFGFIMGMIGGFLIWWSSLESMMLPINDIMYEIRISIWVMTAGTSMMVSGAGLVVLNFEWNKS